MRVTSRASTGGTSGPVWKKKSLPRILSQFESSDRESKRSTACVFDRVPMTEAAMEQNLANGFAASDEVGEVQAGNPLPIGGAHQQGNGVNFVLFSRHANAVRL